MFPDAARIKEVITHPDNYHWLTDDFSPPVEEYEPRPGYYLEPVAGVVVSFEPMFATVWIAHIAALPEARGRGAEAVEKAAAWLREHTAVEVVLAVFPSGNTRIQSLVERSGFERVGGLESCFLRDGELLSLNLYSLRIR